MGIEPTTTAWKAEVLPLNYTRIAWSEWQDSNLRHPAPKAGALPNCATPRARMSFYHKDHTLSRETTIYRENLSFKEQVGLYLPAHKILMFTILCMRRSNVHPNNR